MTIAPDDFKILVDTLEKNSNRTRSIYYVFALIYISITLYVVNAFVYSFPRERMGLIREFVTECQPQQPPPSPQQATDCGNLAKALDEKYPNKSAVPAKTGAASDANAGASDSQTDFDSSGLKHRRDTYLDEIAASRKFTFPLFGVSVDQDYFWLMNSLIGVIIYFVLISALANEAELFCFMVDEVGNDRARLRIVLSSQVLSSPSDHHAKTPRSYTLLKSVLLRSVLLLPIAMGVLWMLSDFGIVGANESFFDSKEELTISYTAEIVQGAAIVIMLCGFWKIHHILSDIHIKYKAGAARLHETDAAAPAGDNGLAAAAMADERAPGSASELPGG